MSSRHPKLLLEDILASAEKILNYTENLSYDDFIADSKTIDAVVRNFEIIGEASNRLPEEFKDENNTVIGLESEDSETGSFINTLVLITRLFEN
jgi:uncharacterized protein with HEPN domain